IVYVISYYHHSVTIPTSFFNVAAADDIYNITLQTLFRSEDECHPTDSEFNANYCYGFEKFLEKVDHDLLKETITKDLQNKNKNRSEEHTSELQSRENLVCRLLLEKKNNINDDAPTNKAAQ